MLDGVKGGCTCPHDPDKVYELLLCRVVLGEYSNYKVVYRSNSKDILKSPPLTADKRPFDSVVYFKPGINGDYVARAAIYDAGQVYPEYIFRYKRAYKQEQQQQLRDSTSSQQLILSSDHEGKENHGDVSYQTSSTPFISLSSSSFSSSLSDSASNYENRSRHDKPDNEAPLQNSHSSDEPDKGANV